MRKLVYISSPLFGDVKRDHSLAWHACRMAMARGNTPFSSHLLYSQMLDCNDPAQRELETRMSGQMLSLCDELWLCGDVISPGMAADEQLAKEQAIPVKYVMDDGSLGTPLMRDLEFSSANPTAATVSPQGIVTGVAAGTAEVTITTRSAKKLTAAAKITVIGAVGAKA